jgi:choline dehydrogenase-like flavoprotein
MIIDSRQLTEDANLRGNIAIIGGGAAGITLAIELARHFRDVLVLESGGTVFEAETQDLYRGRIVGHPQPDLATSRLRFLGGSTNHWFGQCAPLDPVDFDRMPDRPYSGWPIDFANLAPFYDRALRYCEINEFSTPSQAPDPRRSSRAPILSSPNSITVRRRDLESAFGMTWHRQIGSSST